MIFFYFFGAFYREQQDETFRQRYKQENHNGDETPTGQLCHPPAIRQEETHKGDMHTHTSDTCCAVCTL